MNKSQKREVERYCSWMAIAVEAALKLVNGRANAHAYTSMHEIEQVAAIASDALASILPTKDHAGAQYVSTSGDKMPSAYARKGWAPRSCTRVVLSRRTSGWFIIDLRVEYVYPTSKGASCLKLTPGQDEKARTRFATQYSVIKDQS